MSRPLCSGKGVYWGCGIRVKFGGLWRDHIDRGTYGVCGWERGHKSDQQDIDNRSISQTHIIEFISN